jgi:hypothetical protein
MRNAILRSALLLSLALGLVAVVARAQMSVTLSSDIPFSFTVENTTLPAGRYEVHQTADQPWEWTISDAKGLVKVIFTAEPTDAVNPIKANELEFNVYNGDRYFLTRLWIEGEGEYYFIPKTKAERALIMKKTSVAGKRVPMIKKSS